MAGADVGYLATMGVHIDTGARGTMSEEELGCGVLNI